MLKDDLLFTTWSTVREGIVQVFRLVPGGANLFFKQFGWSNVETWHSTILLSYMAKEPDGKYDHTTTKFWQRNGNQYKLAATAPYGQRLEELAKLEHEAKA